MWVRCPKCGYWCYAEKKNFFGRIVRSWSKGDKEQSDAFGKLGDMVGMKGLGKTAGRALNAINISKHGGEMLGGDNYRFDCKYCGNEFGTDDENDDMSAEHALWDRAIELSDHFISVKKLPEQEKRNFIKETLETLAMVENAYGIDEAKAILHDVLGCCYYFFCNDSSKALLEIDKSLDLFDDEKSHVLKGLFMGKVVSPEANYTKLNELIKINECESDIKYVDRATILTEIELAERNYGGNFISIPEHQRKFLVVTSDYTYLPNSFKVLKYNDTRLSGVVFENGFPNNNAIYICHPYKPTVYFPSESYQTDLFKNQLNEFRELLQCLGAKSIVTENSLSSERRSDTAGIIGGKAGGEYKCVGVNTSGNQNCSNSVMESIVQKMLIDDEFSFNPNMHPFIPDGLVWYEHMEEWQRLSRMRLRGQTKYSISISSESTHIVNENEANQVNADFKALVAKGNLEITQSTEVKASENNSHVWKLVVEFYPLSEYAPKQNKLENNQSLNVLTQDSTTSNNALPDTKKKYNAVYVLVAIIISLLIIIALII